MTYCINIVWTTNINLIFIKWCVTGTSGAAPVDCAEIELTYSFLVFLLSLFYGRTSTSRRPTRATYFQLSLGDVK